MVDNQDADIDEIIGQEDLELDELDGGSQKEEQKLDSPPENEEQKAPEDGSGAEPQDKVGEQPKQEETPPQGEEKPVEPPAPLTKQDIQEAIKEFREAERDSTKQIDELTSEVLKKYYPDGLSNTLVDEKSGKELKTPQDVVDASGGSMTTEEAAQWLMNEQFKLDKQVNEIKDQARQLAEINANFDSGLSRVLEKYKDVFAKFPQQQQKIYKAYMQQVKMDKDLVLSAPDIEDFYDLVMEPYVLAFGNAQMQSQPTPQAQPSNQPAPTNQPAQIPNAPPSIEDRLDESGDAGGPSNDADPNDPDESLSKLFGE